MAAKTGGAWCAAQACQGNAIATAAEGGQDLIEYEKAIRFEDARALPG
ncbi:hypothetical protein [Sphingomonas corticis]|jgi:hypothetical protein|uniref:Uncharacterized protein n=1 Tax=Sphingomonas corticis TaxID=2722791 RepID=A0ABX1CQZ3_9SPHN|nr:hypothetical protein [Sphingomonas corticis]NJR79241.1 hypothetical protein [Sphingomonas corticis]